MQSLLRSVPGNESDASTFPSPRKRTPSSAQYEASSAERTSSVLDALVGLATSATSTGAMASACSRSAAPALCRSSARRQSGVVAHAAWAARAPAKAASTSACVQACTVKAVSFVCGFLIATVAPDSLSFHSPLMKNLNAPLGVAMCGKADMARASSVPVVARYVPAGCRATRRPFSIHWKKLLFFSGQHDRNRCRWAQCSGASPWSGGYVAGRASAAHKHRCNRYTLTQVQQHPSWACLTKYAKTCRSGRCLQAGELTRRDVHQ